MSARIRLSPAGVLEGDLVLVDETVHTAEMEVEDPDAGGEFSLPDIEKENSVAVRVLTAEDVASGQYTIHDIVLPTPGYDVTYPKRDDVRQVYVETMSVHGLNPFNMRRLVREVSMVGHYRRVVHLPEYVQWEILRYNGHDTLFDTGGDFKEGKYMALRVQLQLGTSQYATMALREICKRDSVVIQYWGKEREEQEKAKKHQYQAEL